MADDGRIDTSSNEESERGVMGKDHSVPKEDNKQGVSRRDFLRHAGLAGIALGAAGSLGSLAASAVGAQPGGATSAAGGARALQQLKVSANGRFLVREGGTPFFWLGDTAWELFHRLDREAVDLYLKNRQEKGFNVIQAVGLPGLGELDNGLLAPNPYGELPLIDQDPARPNEAYWQHVDYVIEKAEALGLYTALTPTWGQYVTGGYTNGPIVFDISNAYAFGEFLGQRYRAKPIIWVMGGDTDSIWRGGDYRPVFRAMAEGVTVGVAGSLDYSQLAMTYHPAGGKSSSNFLHDEPWLDFNSFESGHRPSRKPFGIDNYKLVEIDYARTPVKPTLDFEPRYEDHPIDSNPKNGYFNGSDIRQAAYWSLFAGAAGHSYGNHNIWQFFGAGDTPYATAPRTPWTEAIDQVGAFDMEHVRNLMESRPFLTRIPDQSIVVSSIGTGMDHVRATRGADGDYAFVYAPTGKSVTVDMSKISNDEVVAWWYDPRSGKHKRIGTFSNTGSRTFESPPADERLEFESGDPERSDLNDWVLVLDAASQHFPPPGRPPAVQRRTHLR